MENIKLPELQTTKTELTTSTEENSVVEVEEKKIPFKIKLLENEVQTSSMPISWCVDTDWLNKTKNYYVLITVAPPTKSGKYKEWRTVAKLSDMVAYITFYSKGRNVIAARLTTSKTEAELWMSRENGKWSSSGMKFQEPWEYEEDIYPGVDKKWEKLYGDGAGQTAEDYIEVDMPEDCFAKEPSEFEKKWVNSFFKGKVIDECNFRKRRIFAYSIQPLILFVLLSFLIAIISIVQIFNILIGKWVVWENIFSTEPNISKRIDFVHVKKFKYLNWIFVPIPALVVISTTLFLLTKIKLWLLLIPIYIILVPLIFLMILSYSYIVPKILKRFQVLYKYFTPKTNYNHNINNSIQIKKKDLEYISMISCYSPTIIKSIKDIPTKKKTIKLRFAKLKSSVCKSYSR